MQRRGFSFKERTLPTRALGNFKNNEPLVNRICDDCQKVFRNLEDVFAHNSPEAFFREMVGRVGRKDHKGKNIFYEPTFGIPPLAMLGQYPGHDFEILWELIPDPANPSVRKCAPMSQLVFISKDGGKAYCLPFLPGKWTAEKIRTILKAQGVTGEQIIAVANTDEEFAEMKALTDVLAPDGKEQDAPAALVAGVEVQGVMYAPISKVYLRAIAKVGFHYFLKYFSHFTGFEPDFDDIKQYIYEGKGARKFVQPVDKPFLRDLQEGAQLKRWAHLLSAESTSTGIEARIQFFAGPEVAPIVWSIVFSEKASKHIQVMGHCFVYFDKQKDGYDGQRGDLSAL